MNVLCICIAVGQQGGAHAELRSTLQGEQTAAERAATERSATEGAFAAERSSPERASAEGAGRGETRRLAAIFSRHAGGRRGSSSGTAVTRARDHRQPEQIYRRQPYQGR